VTSGDFSKMVGDADYSLWYVQLYMCDAFVVAYSLYMSRAHTFSIIITLVFVSHIDRVIFDAVSKELWFPLQDFLLE
jgi:hypothetical protein